MWLPFEMVDREPVCKALRKYGSLESLFDADWEILTKESYWEFWNKFFELRYKYDFEYFAIACIQIRDKLSSKDIPFRLNRGQRHLLSRLERMRLADEPIRLILLKARQWGGSTLVQLYMFWIQVIHRRNWNSVICAHVKDASLTIRAMYERAVRKAPPIYGERLTMSGYMATQNIRVVPQCGALITVGTAVEPESVRSQDAKMAHFSEIAFFPNTALNSTENLETSIVGSIPSKPYTVVVRESTANGVGDYFYNEWEKAVRGEISYDPVFVAWFMIDIYSEAFNGYYYSDTGKHIKGSTAEFVKSLSEYELNLFRNNAECTLENLNWRRLKRSDMSSEAKMKQEYPSDAIEAFQDSGMPAFRSEDVEAMRATCRPPLAVGRLGSDCSPALMKKYTSRGHDVLSGLHFIADPEALEGIKSSTVKVRERAERDKLQIWAYPDTELKVSNRYLVVFDPQKGLSEGADWGVIMVLDRYWSMFGGKSEVVAQWRGRVDKDVTAWIAAQIATFYNNALLVVESNTYDSDNNKVDDTEFIFDILIGHYKNLYSRTPADKIVENIPVKYGFHTSRSTKSMIIDNFVVALREQDYVERCEEALNEMRTYEQRRDGSYGAKAKKHDDIVMTRMIALHVSQNEMPFPKLLDDKPSLKPQLPTGEASL
jgi:hypothetical protein